MAKLSPRSRFALNHHLCLSSSINAMQLQTCLARTTDDLDVPCSSRASPPLSFCRQHYEECCALKEIERSAALEAERLEGIVDKMMEEGAGAYLKVRDVRRMLRWYDCSWRRSRGTLRRGKC